MDRLTKRGGAASSLSNDRIVSGLKEALQIGTANAVSLTGKTDGFSANKAIRIILPERLRLVEKGLRIAGFGSSVDEFELCMNRAAEKAAPEARSIFVGAIREMTLTDGRAILAGGNTAATDYFRSKTTDRLKSVFRPVVSKAMGETDVARSYKQVIARVPAFPFQKKDTFDLDDYVVSKSMDGLFYMLAEEERRIRTDPAARVTSILKEVFGNK